MSRKHPGLLKRLFLSAGDWVYAALITFGREPRETREDRAEDQSR